MRKKNFRGLALGVMMTLLTLSGCSAEAVTDVERTQNRQETDALIAEGEETGDQEEITAQEKSENGETTDREGLENGEVTKVHETSAEQERVENQEKTKVHETSEGQDATDKQNTTEKQDFEEDRETTKMTVSENPEKETQKETTKGQTSKKETQKETTTAQTMTTAQKKETTTAQTSEKETQKDKDPGNAEETTREVEAAAEEEEAPTKDTAAKPATAKPSSTKPEESQSTTAKPTETKPVTTGQATTQATTAKPAATQAAASTTTASTTAAPTTTQVSHSDGGVMRTGMTSRKFRDEMGIGINLGNTMDAYWSSDSRTSSGSQLIGQNTPANYETCWGGRVVTQSMIDSLKASGFNTVRIPVYWGNMMAEDGTFTIDRDYLSRVGEIIDYCRQDGMYVVINIHHYDEYIIKNYPKDQALTIFKNLWSQIAAYYKDYSDYLIFEGFNENVGSTYSGETLSENQIYAYANALNQTFVDAVRRTGGNNASRMLIVSGYWTNIDKTTDSRFQMPTDSVSDRLMVSVHYVDNACYWSNNIGGQSWLDYSRSQCELLKKAFTDQGIVVFVGECTASYENTRFASDAIYKDSAGCTAKLLSMIMDYGFVPVFWDTTGSFYADSSSQAVRNDLQSAIKQVSAK